MQLRDLIIRRILFDAGAGPYFYLSKLESAAEAALWSRIFDWAEA